MIDQTPGPVIAVGHSYGGAVITNAATNAKNAAGLVYVAAFAPDKGERLSEIEGGSKDSVLMTVLMPLQYPTGEGRETTAEFVIDPEKFHDAFAADLPVEQAAVMAATQRPVAELAFSESNGEPAWKNLPSWAIVSTGDKAAGRHGGDFDRGRSGTPEGGSTRWSVRTTARRSCTWGRSARDEGEKVGGLTTRLPGTADDGRAGAHPVSRDRRVRASGAAAPPSPIPGWGPVQSAQRILYERLRVLTWKLQEAY